MQLRGFYRDFVISGFAKKLELILLIEGVTDCITFFISNEFALPFMLG